MVWSMTPSPDLQLCFIHINKTAGSAFDATMAQLSLVEGKRYRIPETRISDQGIEVPNEPNFWGPEYQTARYISGHVCWDEFADRIPRGRFLSSFRDPLDQLVSRYGFNRSIHALNPSTSHPFAERRRECHDRELADLVRDPSCSFYAQSFNIQTLAMSDGIAWRSVWANSQVPDARRFPEFERVAQQRLEQLYWFGLKETIDRDLQTLSASLGIGPIGLLVKANETIPEFRMSADDLDRETRDLLVERLQPDYRLVERARRIAEERHGAVVDRLLSHGGIPQEGREKAVASSLSVAEGNPLMGWHRPESTDAASHVWTGPRTVSYVDLAIPDNCRRWRVELDVLGVMAGTPADIRLLLDGREVSTHVSDGQPSRISADVPGAFLPLRDGQVRVTIIAPGVVRPSDIGGGADVRLLGIAVKRLAIVPSL